MTLPDGRRVVVRHPLITPRDDGLGYTISFGYFLPHASVPWQWMARANVPRKSVLATAARLISDAVISAAVAQGDEGLSGTVVGTVRSNQPVQTFRDAVRQRMEAEGRPSGGHARRGRG